MYIIKTICLENFKSHRQTTLKLNNSRLHAIVGQNNSGKTSILQALSCLGQLVHQPCSVIFQNDRQPKYLISSGENTLNVSVQGLLQGNEAQVWTAGFSLALSVDGDWSPHLFWSEDGNTHYRDSWSNSLHDAPEPIFRTLGHSAYLKLEASKLAQAGYSDEIVPLVRHDGSGLAPMLDYLRGDNLAAFKQIETMLRQIVPGVRSIDVRRAKVEILKQRTIEVDGKALPYEERREMTGQEIVLDMNGGERIPAHAISEGTMLTLGFLTALWNPQKPTLVLLDDIEQGLHPYAQRALIRTLKQILATNQTLQIIFTTHSPYIVDELTPDQVHILHSTDEGYAVTRRLDDHPDAEWASQMLTTGEFWDAEGESWVAQELDSV